MKGDSNMNNLSAVISGYHDDDTLVVNYDTHKLEPRTCRTLQPESC